MKYLKIYLGCLGLLFLCIIIGLVGYSLYQRGELLLAGGFFVFVAIPTALYVIFKE